MYTSAALSVLQSLLLYQTLDRYRLRQSSAALKKVFIFPNLNLFLNKGMGTVGDRQPTAWRNDKNAVNEFEYFIVGKLRKLRTRKGLEIRRKDPL